MTETNNNQAASGKVAPVFAEELVFEELEQRIAPLSGGCATSSSCSCSSSSCIILV